MKVAGCKSASNPWYFYSTDRSGAVVLMLFLLFLALCFPHCVAVFFLYVL